MWWEEAKEKVKRKGANHRSIIPAVPKLFLQNLVVSVRLTLLPRPPTFRPVDGRFLCSVMMENLLYEPMCPKILRPKREAKETKPNHFTMQISNIPLWSLLSAVFLVLLAYVPLVRSQSYKTRAYPFPAATNWVTLTTKKSKFTNRNGHATCTFKGKIWLIGGRTQVYNKYNLLPSTLVADLWYSTDGANWYQENNLAGDFFAQNSDVTQPGGVGPFYERYGHTLDAIDSKTINSPISQNSMLYHHNSSQNDYMIMTGGFSPDPSNDVWISAEGRIWVCLDTSFEHISLVLFFFHLSIFSLIESILSLSLPISHLSTHHPRGQHVHGTKPRFIRANCG